MQSDSERGHHSKTHKISKCPSHAQGNLCAAASSWEPQLVSQTFHQEGENVAETYDWDNVREEHQEEEPAWLSEVDTYNDNDYERDESSPQDDGELEEQFGSLETAEAFATLEIQR